MPFSGIAGAIAGGIGKLAGSALDAHYDRDLARMNQAWQREVYQNQLQWRAQDAKKAGLHPLAAIGNISAPSNIASGSTDFSSALGKLGEGIGDAAVSFMTRDEAAAQAAKKEKQSDEKHDQEIRESAARINMYNSQAVEATKRAFQHQIPFADGTEIVAGQTDAKNYMDDLKKYAWPVYPDGSRGDPVPSSDLSEAYENAPGFFAYTPFIDAAVDKWRAILTGEPLGGYYHDWRDNRWRRTPPPRKNPLRFWVD